MYNLEGVRAVVRAAEATDSAAILQVGQSSGTGHVAKVVYPNGTTVQAFSPDTQPWHR